MAVAIDASSPAIVSGVVASAVTTAPFDPLDSSLLVATTLSSSIPDSITNNGAALTWTQRAVDSNQLTVIYTAPLPSGRTGMTVTATWLATAGRALKVDVLTGADLSIPVGATGSGLSTVNNVTVNAYTSTVDGSRGICGAVDFNDLGAPTSTDDEVAASATAVSGMRVIKAANTTPAGSTVTFNLDAAGTGTPSWGWAAVEILPAAIVVVPTRIVQSVAAVHRASTW